MPPRSASENIDLSLQLDFKPRLNLWSEPPASSGIWSQQRNGKQKVSFGRNIRIRIIPYIHITELSSEEVQAAWYKRSDFRKFRTDTQATIDKLTHRQALDQDECLFGLETLTPRENFVCHQRIRNAISAVLDEQDDQMRYEGCYNHEYLAALSRSHSLNSTETARLIGERQAVKKQEVQPRNRILALEA
jgi:hypothetical protein